MVRNLVWGHFDVDYVDKCLEKSGGKKFHVGETIDPISPLPPLRDNLQSKH
uniref:Uncharacterized protein n=1 Tax=Lepeophtheirus salmonis TaxID=72036 RepID=A0A0K2T919_LEPSM